MAREEARQNISTHRYSPAPSLIQIASINHKIYLRTSQRSRKFTTKEDLLRIKCHIKRGMDRGTPHFDRDMQKRGVPSGGCVAIKWGCESIYSIFKSGARFMNT